MSCRQAEISGRRSATRLTIGMAWLPEGCASDARNAHPPARMRQQIEAAVTGQLAAPAVRARSAGGGDREAWGVAVLAWKAPRYGLDVRPRARSSVGRAHDF